jgi:hypothetical protein
MLAVSLVASLLGILVVAPHANAQAGVDQYVPSPTPPGIGGGTQGAVGGGAPLDADGGAGGSVAAETGSGSAGGGELPFTGYPLTPLLAIVIALLVAGLLLRLAAKLRVASRA